MNRCRSGPVLWVDASYRIDMNPSRISLATTGRSIYRAIDALDSSVDLDPRLRELIRIRASQLNGCAYCLDLHSVDARRAGEDERRIWAVGAWRNNPLFDARERAAFALTDAMTLLPQAGVPEGIYAEAARHFDESELANLIGAIIAINAWNLVGVSTGLEAEIEVVASSG
jgi:AhpD family alkylhydroperoxidase